MAASARMFGRIAKALGLDAAKGKGPAVEATRRGVLPPPPGYTVTRKGILLPLRQAARQIGRRSFDDHATRFEYTYLENLERCSSLFYRISKVIVGSAGCYFMVCLSLYEVRNGNFQNYVNAYGEQRKPLTYLEVKAIVDAVNKLKLEEFSEAFEEGSQNIIVLGAKMIYEHTVSLKKQGISDIDIHQATEVFGVMLTAEYDRLMEMQLNKNAKSPEPVAPQLP